MGWESLPMPCRICLIVSIVPEMSGATEIHGNGIGLFIVKSLLKELDGSISVDSKVNEGTTFTVILRSK